MSDDTPVSQRLQDFSDYFGEDPLDDELEQYMYEDTDLGTTIKHPLVFSIFHVPMLNRPINRQLVAKREALAEAEAEERWHSYVFLHERPFRLDAFMDIEHHLDDEQYWELLSQAWIDSENIRQNPDEWNELLRSTRGDCHNMMSEGERAELDELPDILTIYQGCTTERDDGWSWTTKRETAEWFARRFAMLERSEPVLRVVTVPKSRITAYLTRRNESEVLLDPSLVKESDTQVTSLS